MSIAIMSAVWASGPEDKAELLVLLALADFANDSGICWPAMASVAKKARMSERNARRVIRSLEAAGYLETDEGGGRHGCSQYRINPDKMSPGQNVRPGQNEHETRTKRARNPDIAMSAEPSLTIIEPSKEKTRARRPELPIPEDWTPSDRNLADASAAQFSAEETRHEADCFRDYHLSKGSRFRDWDAAWRTWLRNARKFAPRGMARTAQAGGRGQGSSLASIAARRQFGGGL